MKNKKEGPITSGMSSGFSLFTFSTFFTLSTFFAVVAMVVMVGWAKGGREVIETVTETIPAPVKQISTPRLHVGETFVIPGRKGKVKKVVKRTYRDGRIESESVLSMSLMQSPKRTVRVVGTSQDARPYMMKRPMHVKKSMTLRATAYYPGPEDCGIWADGYTYLDFKAGYGVCAVDPKVIPLRSRLYIEGYGYALAVDIGSAIKGKRIDLCYNTLSESTRYGVKYVKVHILE